MDVKFKPMGDYQTNCYIASVDGKDFVIDPGVGATNWVMENAKNARAILNTHGHFDHVWSNSELKEKLNIPIYCPKDDCFMLEEDPFSYGLTKSKADFKIDHDEQVVIDGVKIKFHFFPGHTPGCSVIEINDTLFSGDFIFKGTIGRFDFPYSDAMHMKQSLRKILNWEKDKDMDIFCGHGEPTRLLEEQEMLKGWLRYI